MCIVPLPVLFFCDQATVCRGRPHRYELLVDRPLRSSLLPRKRRIVNAEMGFALPRQPAGESNSFFTLCHLRGSWTLRITYITVENFTLPSLTPPRTSGVYPRSSSTSKVLHHFSWWPSFASVSNGESFTHLPSDRLCLKSKNYVVHALSGFNSQKLLDSTERLLLSLSPLPPFRHPAW